MTTRFSLQPAIFLAAAGIIVLSPSLRADVLLDDEALGKSLGGWKGKKQSFAEYSLSGSKYRTFRPEITETPEGGIFLSVRIDYERGFFASDDFATLEMTFGPDGRLSSTSASIAIQGKRINSDVIREGSNLSGDAGLAGTAVKMGGDLVASLTEKLSRENVVEAGRVTFPAAVRHNYNKVFQAVRHVPDVHVPALPQMNPATPGAGLAVQGGVGGSVPLSPPTPQEKPESTTGATAPPQETPPTEPASQQSQQGEKVEPAQDATPAPEATATTIPVADQPESPGVNDSQATPP